VLGEGRYRFRFINETREMQLPLNWHDPELSAGTRLWKLNLHYHEFLAGLADRDFEAITLDWIAANPPFEFQYWMDSWNSYSLSIRVVVWMQQLAARSCVEHETRNRLLDSLVQQLRFLERNLETDIGGNHIIKNLKALIWASTFFAGPDAKRWDAMGLKLLAAALPEQILADGMHYERSPSYHCQVFADLLEIRHAWGGDRLGGQLDATLAQMAQVTADLTHPDGHVALFNDAGLGMAYEPAECLQVYQGLFNEWPQSRAVFALESAGYFGSRTADSYFILDCGRIAPDDLPAHGHGDVLSFEWSVDGKRIIVDQGVFEYNSGERRRRSRAAESHNTLCFDGADQADFFGAFRCGRRPNVDVLTYRSDGSGFVLEGTHDGFAYLEGAPQHIRRVEVRPREISIHDRISGKSDLKASIAFLLAPGVQPDVSEAGALIRSGSGRIRMISTLPIEVEEGVWWPDMGRQERTKRLRVRLAPGVSEVSTAFMIERNESR